VTNQPSTATLPSSAQASPLPRAAQLTRTPDQVAADYHEFRGRCRELCALAIATDPSLRLVRGHYWEGLWPSDPEQPHWWCVKPDGTIVDPSARQFPSNGAGEYVEFTGFLPCAQCGTVVHENDAVINGNYGFCTTRCACEYVGIDCS